MCVRWPFVCEIYPSNFSWVTRACEMTFLQNFPTPRVRWPFCKFFLHLVWDDLFANFFNTACEMTFLQIFPTPCVRWPFCKFFLHLVWDDLFANFSYTPCEMTFFVISRWKSWNRHYSLRVFLHVRLCRGQIYLIDTIVCKHFYMWGCVAVKFM